MPPGRPRGRKLAVLEVRHLKLLLEIRTRAQAALVGFDELLEDYVLELREDGASVRGIAAELGVSPSAVQGWTDNARRRRGQTS